jgi:hypothetical protein
MKSGYIKSIVILVAVLLAIGPIQAGPPADMWKPGQLWMAAEYGMSYRPVPGENQFDQTDNPLDSRSNRAILKAGYEVYPWLDLFALVGLADLRIAAGDPTFNDHRSDMNLAWGGGAKLGYFYIPYNLGTSLTGTCIGFTSEAQVNNQYRTVVNNYQWYEIQLEWVLTYPLTSITPFAGVEKTLLMGIHEMEDYFLGRMQPRPDNGDTYSDNNQSIRPLAGFSVHLPGDYSVYLKACGLKSDDFYLGFGICQGSK